MDQTAQVLLLLMNVKLVSCQDISIKRSCRCCITFWYVNLQAVHQLTEEGIGQTTAVGIGGDPVNGTNFIDVLKAFNEDEDTKAVVMIGEIGGTAEEAAEWIKANMTKPVIGSIGGQTALQVNVWVTLVRLFLAVKVLQMKKLKH